VLPFVFVIFLSATSSMVLAQRAGDPASGPGPGAIPIINVGGNAQSAQFASLDFAQIILDQQSRSRSGKELARQKELVQSGELSELDLAAPDKAVSEFNQATALLRGQHSQDAVVHLQKALILYPKFVSAHNYLGLAYQDADNPGQARSEFQAAADLDAKFARSFVNLGRLCLSQSDFVAAQANLEKAAVLRPSDAGILTVLAYAQNGNHQYREAIATAARVHALDHPGMGNAHYVAAVSAIALNDYPTAQAQFALFLQEDPSNPLAPGARHNLDVLNQKLHAPQPAQSAAVQPRENPANSDRLRAELASASKETADDRCAGCAGAATVAEASPEAASIPGFNPGAEAGDQWTIHKVVDEVAVFFGVTSGGHIVNGLELNDIRVRDDNRPPEKVLQFTPQSKLPLRIGLLIDTSGSVQPRFAFEKQAAAKFLQQMLSNTADLGFVAGFADSLNVTQTFTGDRDQLGKAAERLTNGGGTALFDAVSRACWMLAAYPEHERVARVLVVLSDGEENASHSSLRQTIRDVEATGVTVYTISTKEGQSVTTEADKVLKTLAERSGGEAFFPGDMPTLSKSFDRLRDEIRSRYLIAYRPADFEANGKYRTIAISAEKDGKHLQVHARKGYHARAEAPTP
jgi:Ca-activated chloride channel homolog